MLSRFDQLKQAVKDMDNKRVAVAAAQSPATLEAVVMMRRESFADCVLTGDEAAIRAWLGDNAPDLTDAFAIHDTGDDICAACAKAVALVCAGDADLILKGKGGTADLLRAVLDKEKGLRTGNVLSDVLVYETPDRLMLMSDGGINLYPEIKDMASIVNNAVAVAHKMNNPCPKVALLAAVELVNPKMQCTMDAALLAQMNQRGQIRGCVVDGPLAFDNAISPEAARIKGIQSEVAGCADILIVPNIESGNIFGKALTYYCKWRVAHVVMGARVPILIPSRADAAETKLLSMLLGILCA
ncbi:MAG: bifunctional enoyl-CoA hydratase/phosphate acetyltransferase [Candidatus Cloacimonetes bacterium]|nr:bifunctional enoyl-CoA hydratase/phosphate acetyltransferase [Candidatus Cloacimonadota bacterium]